MFGDGVSKENIGGSKIKDQMNVIAEFAARAVGLFDMKIITLMASIFLKT